MPPTQPSATLLLVRHGQSTWNAEGRWQGQADPPLSRLGRDQAHLAAQRIGAVDAIIASPQQRALETAMIVSTAIGVGPVLVADDLRERHAGPWSGLSRPDIDEQYPGYLDDGRRPDGYETDEPLLARTLAALDEIAADNPRATVMVATHGGVIHNLEQHLGLTLGRVPNLSGRIVHRIDDQWRAGEQLTLLDADLLSGGDPNRV
ncbi:MAG: broad specificity phosphatase PhoE [Acidimicrobiales bacterium]